MHATRSQTVRLVAGACRMWRANAGTEFAVVHGRVRVVEACRLVADHLISPEFELGCGAPHRVEDAGWVSLSALAECELRISAPVSSTAAGVWHALRRIIATLSAARPAPRT